MIKAIFVPFLCAVIIAYSFTLSTLFESFFELKQAQAELQVSLEEWKASQERVQKNLDDLEKLLELQKKFNEGT